MEKNKFSENAKATLGRPIDNKDNRDKIKTIGHLSLLNGDFSQIYDKFLHDSLSAFTDKILTLIVQIMFFLTNLIYTIPTNTGHTI